MTTDSNIPAAIYVRISRDAEETGLGVARQRKDCNVLAKSKGWQVVETFEDNDVSATSGKPRPAYLRMVRDIEAGRIRGIIVWDVDRLTRTPRELEDLIDWADQHGLHLANVGGEIDLGTPQGRMTARIKGAVARHETEQSSRRIKRKHQQLAEAGAHHGPRPYGWDVTTEKRLVINEAEAAVIREAYERVLAGDSLNSIIVDFNDREIPTRMNKQWSSATLRSKLKRWTNCGVRTYHGKEVGPGTWHPIVDRETHEQVLAILSDPRRLKHNRGTAVKYLFSNLIHCAECDGKLVTTAPRTLTVKVKRKGGYEAKERAYPGKYACKNRGCSSVSRHMDDLDQYFTERILTILERDGVRIMGGSPGAYESAKSRMDSIEAKLALTADQFADDLITAEQFQRITRRLKPQLEQARAELQQSLPAAQGLADFAGPNARQAWNDADLEHRREVIKMLIENGMKMIVYNVGRRRLGEVPPPPSDPENVRVLWNE